MPNVVDTPLLRKQRGAFFTPPELAEFIAKWAIRDPADRVLEPSCGDAVFLVAAANLLDSDKQHRAQLVGYDLHEDSIVEGRAALGDLPIAAEFHLGDFFEATPHPSFDAVIGNPPYIRFQGFGGASRSSSLQRAAAAGVNISGLASSWAAFVVHSSTFLKRGGRMGLVLPAELLSVNYASSIREYLLHAFASIELVLFEELVFAGVQADVVVLLADGYLEGASEYFAVYQAKNVAQIESRTGVRWKPLHPSAKWTDALVAKAATEALTTAHSSGLLEPLESWGAVTSGMVTGANSFFCMTPQQAAERGIDPGDLVKVLPSGFSLARLDSVTENLWTTAGDSLRSVMFRPTGELDSSAKEFITLGESLMLHERYKCRVRSPWWLVPLNSAPDMFVSYMSGSTPRIVANSARLHNLNSIHGLYVEPHKRGLAKRVLPLMSLSSHSLMSGELEGRTYGGGVLKMEPREADRWLVVSEAAANEIVTSHLSLLSKGARLMRSGDLAGATAIADSILDLVAKTSERDSGDSHAVRDAHASLVRKRLTRGATKSAISATAGVTE